MSWQERDPKKRKVKPVEQPLYDLDLESSDDSDFDPEEHKEASDDSLDSNDGSVHNSSGSSEEDEDDDDSSDEDSDDLDEAANSKSLELTSEYSQQRLDSTDAQSLNSEIIQKFKKQIPRRCWGCLGDRNDEFDELVECDECGVIVHEKCYGMSDSESLASVDSANPALPWFCDTCRAGVKDPPCELCPNSGGIFKETDTGRWVHLVCALYIPGLFPTDGEKLSLFKMPYSKFGAKSCTLCEDERLARSGVCIECDAGMCRTYFHASCAQRLGLLQEAHPEEMETVDKFYAHCKLHTDKAHIRRRRQNFILLQERLKERKSELEEKESAELERIQRKFLKARRHYSEYHSSSTLSFVPPTQRMPRALVTSATACRRLWHKANLAGLDTHSMEIQEAQVASIKDINRKWHIPASFSVEFIAYFLDRMSRISKLKKQLQDYAESNSQLADEQKTLEKKYAHALSVKMGEDEQNAALKQKVKIYHEVIQLACPKKNLPSVASLCKPAPSLNHLAHGVPTAAALKAFPSTLAQELALGGSWISHKSKLQSNSAGNATVTELPMTPTAAVLGVCGICHQSNDPHLLAHCDSCKRYYHLGCLNPPLTRMPKKTKLMGWQCSECDKESSGSDVPCLDPEAPRKLRHKSDSILSKTPYKSEEEVLHNESTMNSTNASEDVGNEADVETTLCDSVSGGEIRSKSMKKKRREKRRYSPEPGDSIERKRKRKKKSFDHKTWSLDEPSLAQKPQPHVPKIKIKTITSAGEGQAAQTYVASAMTSDEDVSRPVQSVQGTAPAMQGTLPQGSLVQRTLPLGTPTQRTLLQGTSSQRTLQTIIPTLGAPTLGTPSPGAPILGTPTQGTLSHGTQGALSQGIQSPAQDNLFMTSQKRAAGRKGKLEDIMTQCDDCKGPGSKENLVRCDECKKCFHFHCLDPPVKKSPKIRGYSWHCADCDPSDSGSEGV